MPGATWGLKVGQVKSFHICPQFDPNQNLKQSSAAAAAVYHIGESESQDGQFDLHFNCIMLGIAITRISFIQSL